MPKMIEQSLASLELQQHLPLAVLKHLYMFIANRASIVRLQQHLPLAVLKLIYFIFFLFRIFVATAPTACGIETLGLLALFVPFLLVATAPTACGIETSRAASYTLTLSVATAPTACGIET